MARSSYPKNSSTAQRPLRGALWMACPSASPPPPSCGPSGRRGTPIAPFAATGRAAAEVTAGGSLGSCVPRADLTPSRRQKRHEGWSASPSAGLPGRPRFEPVRIPYWLQPHRLQPREYRRPGKALSGAGDSRAGRPLRRQPPRIPEPRRPLKPNQGVAAVDLQEIDLRRLHRPLHHPRAAPDLQQHPVQSDGVPTVADLGISGTRCGWAAQGASLRHGLLEGRRALKVVRLMIASSGKRLSAASTAP